MACDFDIIISGGGLAGLTASCLFGSAGYRVLCVDPAPPVTQRDADGSDLRSTALLQPAIPVLERAGLWQQLASFATPLQTMRIIDANGVQPSPRVMREFEASDISDMPFGWNVPNWLFKRELADRIAHLPSVELRTGVTTERIRPRLNQSVVWLSDGTRPGADLVIAADGRNSRLRRAAGIDVTTRHYGQKALAFAVTHSLPHNNVSTEIHLKGGPFTTVPLPDYDGQPSSAIVWMERAGVAQELSNLSQSDLETAMLDRSCGILGEFKLASRVSIWPIISQIAHRFSARRLALVAEAAHVVPPIGAQGLNMSLADIDSLFDLSQRHGLGSQTALDAYATHRQRDARIRVSGIDMLNRVSMADNTAITYLRSLGIGLIHDTAPLRKSLMSLGLGGSLGIGGTR
ncbi:MAG: FAD-dependent monooxygenase [Pseudomonadota bacterium]